MSENTKIGEICDIYHLALKKEVFAAEMHAYVHIFGAYKHCYCMARVCHTRLVLLHRRDLVENVDKFQSRLG